LDLGQQTSQANRDEDNLGLTLNVGGQRINVAQNQQQNIVTPKTSFSESRQRSRNIDSGSDDLGLSITVDGQKLNVAEQQREDFNTHSYVSHIPKSVEVSQQPKAAEKDDDDGITLTVDGQKVRFN